MREFMLTINKAKETVIHKIFADSFEIQNNRIIFCEKHKSILGTAEYQNKVGSFQILDDSVISYEVTSSLIANTEKETKIEKGDKLL